VAGLGRGSRRILVTGLSSWPGGRLAQALEHEPDVEAIVGVDTEEPRHELERTEFVRVATDPALLRRIISAAGIDTVIDTRLRTDALAGSLSDTHANNVTGTRNVLEALSGRQSPVRKLVFASSALYYGSAAGDPAFFTEEMRRTTPASTAIERDVITAERAVLDFAVQQRQMTVTVLRFAEVMGSDQRAAQLLGLPVLPAILGFDPRVQFIDEEDAIGALAHVARHRLPGAYNAAGDGVLALSELASLLGKSLLPVLPPWGVPFAAAQLRRIGIPVPLEQIRQLRYGRGLDNRRLKASGYAYRYTTRESVLKLRAQQRLRPLLRSGNGSYRYEREVEEFLRWSRSVRPAEARTVAGRTPAPFAAYDRLAASEVIEIIASLEPDDLARLREYEVGHHARAAVLEALDETLGRRHRHG
jgi:UDP-glucose 4-epimerase